MLGLQSRQVRSHSFVQSCAPVSLAAAGGEGSACQWVSACSYKLLPVIGFIHGMGGSVRLGFHEHTNGRPWHTPPIARISDPSLGALSIESHSPASFGTMAKLAR